LKIKGKNFSANNCNGIRNFKDEYQTHYSITEQLLENEFFDYQKTILEPACGKLAIVKILNKYFLNGCDYFDINLKEDSFNFFECCNQYDYIITNPPFKLAFEFIEKSKQIAKEKFAMLLPLSYLHGQKRYESKIFTDETYPLITVYIFTRYPLLESEIREDGKYKTGMMVYAWFIWKKIENWKINLQIKNSIPIIKWIDNNPYIINSIYKQKEELNLFS
jgi:hypothetical protein